MSDKPHERIWLQYHDEDGEPNDYGESVTWCKDKINDTDVEYVRADAAVAQSKEIRELVEALMYVESNYDGMNKADVVTKALTPFTEASDGK
jgi:hypothetical protein